MVKLVSPENSKSKNLTQLSVRFQQKTKGEIYSTNGMIPMLFINPKLTKTEDVILIKDVGKLDMWYFLRLQVGYI